MLRLLNFNTQRMKLSKIVLRMKTFKIITVFILLSGVPSGHTQNEEYLKSLCSSGKHTASALEVQIIKLVNEKRVKNNLKPLTENPQLSCLARVKSDDMRYDKSFKQYSPRFGTLAGMIEDIGIKFQVAGGNILATASSPNTSAVVAAWLEDEGRKEIMLHPDVTQIGVGYSEGGPDGHYWTQIFMQPAEDPEYTCCIKNKTGCDSNLIKKIKPTTSDKIARSLKAQCSGMRKELYESESKIVTLVNIERKKRGLKALFENPMLSCLARIKSEDMRDDNYYGHYSPKFGSPFKMMSNIGIRFQEASQNILILGSNAGSSLTAERAMNVWMNSKTHSDIILHRDTTNIGVGFSEEVGRHFWTQMFMQHPYGDLESLCSGRTEISPQVREIVKFLNDMRSQQGKTLKPLTANAELSCLAGVKSDDMRDHNDVLYVSPRLGSSFRMMENIGIKIQAGSQITVTGKGMDNANDVVAKCMEKTRQEDRKNILSSQYTDVGVGYSKGGSQGHYWTLVFVKRAKKDENRIQTSKSANENRANDGNNLEITDLKTVCSRQLEQKGAKEVQRLIELLNKERDYDDKGLKENILLSCLARLISDEMRDHDYYDYYSQIRRSPFTMMEDTEVKVRTGGQYTAFGKNLTSPESVVADWMKKNEDALNIRHTEIYTEVGVHVSRGGSQGNYWTVLFVQPLQEEKGKKAKKKKKKSKKGK